MKTIHQIQTEITSGQYDALLTRIYGSENIPNAKARYLHILEESLKRFGDAKGDLYRVPGRCEIGGNHTDHQLGHVIAGSIDIDLVVFAAKNEDQVIRYHSDAYPVTCVDISDLEIHEEQFYTTESLIRGIASKFVQNGYSISGFDCYGESQVLPGSGFSSSACFEIMIGTILSHISNADLVSKLEIAQIGQYAENVYFHKSCGLMDQVACAMGGVVGIDFYDAQNPVMEAMEVDLSQYRLVFTNVKDSHDELSDEYSLIVKEMKDVANFFHQDVLSRITLEDLFAHAKEVRQTCGDRAFLRAYHFLQEDKRAVREKEALREGKISDFLTLVKQSGASSYMYLQNVLLKGSVERQSLAVALALSESMLQDDGAYRVHGGGFAGTILAVVPLQNVQPYIALMNSVFGDDSAYCYQICNVGSIVISENGGDA